MRKRENWLGFEEQKDPPNASQRTMVTLAPFSSKGCRGLREARWGLQNRASLTLHGTPPSSLHHPGTRAAAAAGSLKGQRPRRSGGAEGGVGPTAPTPARPPHPRAPARARAGGGSAVSRTSGCCLDAVAASLRSPRSCCRRLGSRRQERRHRHGRHQRWAWGVGRWRAGLPPRGMSRGAHTGPARRLPGPGARRGVPALVADPRPPALEPRRALWPRGKDDGVGGFPGSPHFLLSSAASFPPLAPRPENEVASGCWSPATARAITCVLQSSHPRARRAECGFEGDEVARDASGGKSVSFPS